MRPDGGGQGERREGFEEAGMKRGRGGTGETGAAGGNLADDLGDGRFGLKTVQTTGAT